MLCTVSCSLLSNRDADMKQRWQPVDILWCDGSSDLAVTLWCERYCYLHFPDNTLKLPEVKKLLQGHAASNWQPVTGTAEPPSCALSYMASKEPHSRVMKSTSQTWNNFNSHVVYCPLFLHIGCWGPKRVCDLHKVTQLESASSPPACPPGLSCHTTLHHH